jgi:hypothetical protein
VQRCAIILWVDRGITVKFHFRLLLTLVLAVIAQPNLTIAQTQRAALVSKAEARENENGFCKTVNWQPQATLVGFYNFLSTSRANSEYVVRSLYSYGKGCTFYRVNSVSDNNNKKCVRLTGWYCLDGMYCDTMQNNWCRNSDGNWVSVD